MGDSVYYQRCLCEKCGNEDCGMHGKRIYWAKGHTCGNFIDPNALPEDDDDITEEYEGPDLNSIFPPGWGNPLF